MLIEKYGLTLGGNLINELVNKRFDKGYHSLIWDGKNEMENDVSSGLYIYILCTYNSVISKKMLLLKGVETDLFSFKNLLSHC